jgi:hypothetical protein
MAHRPNPSSRLFARLAGIVCLVALGALLAGCDKCGDWPWSPAGGQVCRQQAPKPQ